MVQVDASRFTPKPRFRENPIQNLRFHARVSPQYFFPLALAFVSIPVMFTILPIRRRFLYPDHQPIPFEYPLPKDPVEVTGFEDE
ncbi:uncharacterized protein V2V93DRAFT_363681 [Kockiozyma suomiensis]|uniref:uncharacterized protein n=1 Tax=Kockiozyma suomiensis TaxID=1337062 RepID=UPI0033430895